MRLAISSKSKNAQYPQPEGSLGDAWIKVGQELEDTAFGKFYCSLRQLSLHNNAVDDGFSLFESFKTVLFIASL